MADREYTLIEHLTELRKRLIVCLATVFICSVICYLVVKKILFFLMAPVGELVFIAPHEAFVAYLKLSLIAGVFVASPIILYQVWRFVSSGLKQDEKKYLIFYVPLSFIFFLGGGLFAYFLILPLGLKFLLGLGTDILKPMISLKYYISFAGMLLLAFGIVFELPLVIMFLTKIGLVTPKVLRKKRKYIVFLIFIIAALLTPPDVITQLLMAGPLILLYEISILLSKFVSPSIKSKA
jgi:sec-independent protein translocase protein TatC